MIESINLEYLKNILTLRYDPTQRSILKPLQPEDFFPIRVSNIDSQIYDLIKNNFLEEQKTSNFKTVSLSLSAGIDSGLTLACIREILPNVKINCVGVGFGNKDDEINRARELSRIYDCNFIEVIKENILEQLPKLIGIVKEPRWNLYNFYALEEGVKKSEIFYTGDGGDELFGGYTFRLEKFLLNTKKDFDWKQKTQLYLNCHERDWVVDQENLFGKRMKFSWNSIYNLFKPYFDNQLSPINQVFLADFNGKLLYDWLLTNEAYEKYFKLKIKSIFLNDKMINFATHIDWKEKYDPSTGLGKIPLRKIIKKFKGFENAKLSKKGFGTDLEDLWNKNSKEIIFTFVNKDSEVIKENLIDLSWVEKTKNLLSNSPKPDIRYINKLMSLLALEIWFRIFISKSMKQSELI
jgi:asparagine synthase (glutamine-hydrolysing)